MTIKIILTAGLVVLIGFLFGFQQKTPTEKAKIKKV